MHRKIEIQDLPELTNYNNEDFSVDMKKKILFFITILQLHTVNNCMPHVSQPLHLLVCLLMRG